MEHDSGEPAGAKRQISPRIEGGGGERGAFDTLYKGFVRGSKLEATAVDLATVAEAKLPPDTCIRGVSDDKSLKRRRNVLAAGYGLPVEVVFSVLPIAFAFGAEQPR